MSLPIMFIDRVNYSKLRYPLGRGYDKRPNGLRPSSIVVHTTNGNRGSSFSAEGRYLRDAAGVGAHYLVGKEGQLAEVLPVNWRAWHAGPSLSPWINSRSIGIECHFTPGEQWTEAQRLALTWLVQHLMAVCGIGRNMVETHRAVALPPGRKIDPSGWDDKAFYRWRAALSPLV